MRRWRGATALAVLMVVQVAILWGPAPARASEPPPGPTRLGVLLDFGSESAASYTAKAGASPAFYGKSVPLPLGAQDEGYLSAYFAQLAASGSDAMVTVSPSVPLDRIADAEARDFAQRVASAARGFPGHVYVRFAPLMNAPWVAWGQQPSAFVASFRAVASAFRSSGLAASMVWAPASGADYPFRASTASPPSGAALSEVDTNHDGTFGPGDDPYAPYYPGDDVVDWVGLSAYHDPTSGRAAANVVPAPGEFEKALGAVPGGFYSAYAAAKHKPMLIETAAYFSRQAGGPAEADVKAQWWDQVFGAVGSKRYPQLRAVMWNETTEKRGDGAADVDWRATADPTMAASFLRAARADGLTTGPVFAASTHGMPADPAAAAGSGGGLILAGPAAWAAGAALPAAAVVLWLIARRRESLRYAEPGPRDRRIDLLRGLAIVFVVVDHLALPSLFQLGTQESIGAVSGAELFVFFSGAVLGMVHGERAKTGLGDVLGRTSRRARTLYITALVVVIGVWLLSLVPGIDARPVTSFTDQGTGAAGHAAAGRIYDLYSGMDQLLQYPVPPDLIPRLLLLEFGPWQFNIMGLYVVLLLISPLALAAIARGWWWLVLGVSLVLYAVGSGFHVRLLPSQFEDSFPLLVWQVLFTIGLVAGSHRTQIVAWFTDRRHRAVLVACIASALALALFSASNPYLVNAWDVRLGLVPPQVFQSVYDMFFGRTYLGVGRLVNTLVVVIAGYALLTTFWAAVERAVGWFLVPLGQATLYVFVLHVFFALAVANVPWLGPDQLLVNTAAYALILALLWAMVRTRFLFSVIPR